MKKKMKRIKHSKTSETVNVSSELVEKECSSELGEDTSSNTIYSLRSRSILNVKESGIDNDSAHTSRKNSIASALPLVTKKGKFTQSISCKKTVTVKKPRGRPLIANKPTHRSQKSSICQKTEDNDTTKSAFKYITHISKLPNEILTMIFSFLNIHELSISVAPVCKHWYSLAHNPLLWRELVFNEKKEVIHTDILRLLRKSPFLLELTISNRKDLETILNEVCYSNRRLESLAIKQSSESKVLNSWDWPLIRAEYMNRLIKFCPNIKKLKMKEVKIRSDKFYRDLGVLLPNLTTLHLSHSHYLTPIHIINIAMKCCNLAQLWLSGDCCCGPSEAWEKAFNVLFQQRCKTLTHLQFDASRLADHSFKDLSLCTNLKVLHLHRAIHLGTQGSNAVGSLCNLVSLRLHKALDLGSHDLISMLERGNLKSLVSLSLAETSCVSDVCTVAIALHCPNIHMLSLALVQNVTDVGVEIILERCSSLHYLDLYCTKCVTGSSFSLIQKCPNLKFLVIEEVLDGIKEMYMWMLMGLCATVKVHRTQVWKTAGLYSCDLLK